MRGTRYCLPRFFAARLVIGLLLAGSAQPSRCLWTVSTVMADGPATRPVLSPPTLAASIPTPVPATIPIPMPGLTPTTVPSRPTIPDSRPMSATVPASAPTTAPGIPAIHDPLHPSALDGLLPDSAGSHKIRFATRIGDKPVALPARLFLPKSYEKAKEPLPLVLFLHDEKDRGVNLTAIAQSGIEHALRANDNLRDHLNLISLSPQCPSDLRWDDPVAIKAVLVLLDDLARQLRFDPDRVYVSGVGMGAAGAWRLAIDNPDRFAAVVANSSPAVSPAEAAVRLKYVPAYVVCAASDKESMAGQDVMVEALKTARCEVDFAQLGASRDECAQNFYTAQASYDWMLKQHRRSVKERQDRDLLLARQTDDELAALPKTPGHYRLQSTAWAGAQAVNLPYTLYLPAGYDGNTDIKWPLLVYLNDAAEANIDKAFARGPNKFLQADARFRDYLPFIVVAPIVDGSSQRCRAALGVVRQIAARFRVDPDRIYLSGVGAGATGTWQMTALDPAMWAALLPIGGKMPDPSAAGLLAHTNLWMITIGADANSASQASAMCAALGKIAAPVRFSQLPGLVPPPPPAPAPNAAAVAAFISATCDRLYSDRRLYEWFLSQRRMTAEQWKTTQQQSASAFVPTPGEHRHVFHAKVGDKTVDLPYVCYLPDGYDKNQDSLPAMLYLHDTADCGTELTSIFNYGSGGPVRLSQEVPATLPFIGIAPQCPSGRRWDEVEITMAVMALLDDEMARLRMDRQRIYAAGTGTGGAAAWGMFVDAPERFIGVACSSGLPARVDQLGAAHRFTPVWLGVVGNEGGIADKMKDAAEQLAHAALQVEFEPNPQEISLPFYSDPKFTKWMLKQKRLEPGQRDEMEKKHVREELLGPLDFPGVNKRVWQTQLDGKDIELPYIACLPAAYNKNKDVCPVVLMLHDLPTCGNDGAAITKWGPCLAMQKSPALRDACKVIVLAPQCPANRRWDDSSMLSLLDRFLQNMAEKLRVDDSRVYIAGEGMGAAAAWRLDLVKPDRFAAFSPIGIWGIDPQPADIEAVRYQGIWLHAPLNDLKAADAARHLAEGLRQVGAEMELDLAAIVGDPPWQSLYSDAKFYDWFYRHHRLPPQDRDKRDIRRMEHGSVMINDAPGTHKLHFSACVDGQVVDIPYMLYFPRGYDQNNSLWPGLVFLHGAGEADRNLSGMWKHGPQFHMLNDVHLREWFPFVNICPIHDNTPTTARAIVQLVDFLESRCRIDPERMYMTGFSLGGTSTWTIAEAGPDRFAAIAPICGRVAYAETAGEKLKYVKTWAICGDRDGPFFQGTQQMVAALQQVGADIQTTYVPGHAHDVWPLYFKEQRFYDWFLYQRRLTSRQRATLDRGPMPLASGLQRRNFAVQLGGKDAMINYMLYIPRGYDPSSGKWPLMLYLHSEADAMDVGPIIEWGDETDPRADDKTRMAFPMIGVAPQCPDGKAWGDAELSKALLALLDDVAAMLKVDPDRVYAAGQGKGAAGVWQLALDDPDRFAGLAPVGPPASSLDASVAKLKYAAVRFLSPAGDVPALQAARQNTSVLRKAGADVTVAILPKFEPQTWRPYYTAGEFCAWCLAHCRLTPQQRAQRDQVDARNAAVVLTQAPGLQKLQFQALVGGKAIDITYRLFFPTVYDKGAEKVPMLMFLGEVGGWSLDSALTSDDKLRDLFPLIGLWPQCPRGMTWDDPLLSKALLQLAEEMARRLRLDEDRVYLAGANVACASLWKLAIDAPDRFAAIVSASAAVPSPNLSPSDNSLRVEGLKVEGKPEETAGKLRSIPAWLVVGDNEAPVADADKQLADAITKAHGEVQLSILPQPTSESWQAFFTDATFSQWLLKHRKQ